MNRTLTAFCDDKLRSSAIIMSHRVQTATAWGSVDRLALLCWLNLPEEPISPAVVSVFWRSHAAVWNSLSGTVLKRLSLAVFNSRLKTHWFHLDLINGQAFYCVHKTRLQRIHGRDIYFIL